MRKFLYALLFLGLGAVPAAHAASTLPPRPVVAEFPAGSADVMRVQVNASERVERIELVAPDGRVWPAAQVVTDRVSQQVPNPGGVGGDGRYHPWFGWYGDDPARGDELGGPAYNLVRRITPRRPTHPAFTTRSWISSQATIRVTDMPAYRADWPRWQLRIRFAESGRIDSVRPPIPPRV